MWGGGGVWRVGVYVGGWVRVHVGVGGCAGWEGWDGWVGACVWGVDVVTELLFCTETENSTESLSKYQ